MAVTYKVRIYALMRKAQSFGCYVAHPFTCSIEGEIDVAITQEFL